jgi:hypothetical protein
LEITQQYKFRREGKEMGTGKYLPMAKKIHLTTAQTSQNQKGPGLSGKFQIPNKKS